LRDASRQSIWRERIVIKQLRRPLRFLAAALALIAVQPALARPVLLISIDGLRPADVLDAQQRGLKLPNLTAFLTQGSYAHGVVGVLPTLT
jgi:hypothetical protein